MSNILRNYINEYPRRSKAAAAVLAGALSISALIGSCSEKPTQEPAPAPATTTVIETPTTTEYPFGDGCDNPTIDTGETIWDEASRRADPSDPYHKHLVNIMMRNVAELGYESGSIPAGTELTVCLPLPE
jgi:hypothetical protein